MADWIPFCTLEGKLREKMDRNFTEGDPLEPEIRLCSKIEVSSLLEDTLSPPSAVRFG